MESGPYADLYAFNTSASRLMELVNTYLNDPFNDSENLRVLQPMMAKLVETCEEVIKRKANRAIAEMIVQNFNMPNENPPVFTQNVPLLPGLTSNKRKSPETETVANGNEKRYHLI